MATLSFSEVRFFISILLCIHDIHQGAIKSGEEIFEGGIQFYLSTITNGDRDEAVRLTRKNMNTLPYWQAHPFGLLDGVTASDEEFAAAMKKLM